MSDRNEIVEGEDTASKAQKSANRLRRQIVKAGAVAVPTIISLQSGTAWAISSCASRGEPLADPGTIDADIADVGNRGLVLSGNRC